MKTATKRTSRKGSATTKSVPSVDDFIFEKKPLYSPAEIARILDVSDQTVLDWIHSDKLFAAQIGPRLFRIPLGSLMQFLGVPPQIRWTRGSKARRIVDAEFERAEPGAKPARNER
ncbi:MAG TPA: helix-turn-helix domain-containing protein [Candidatus Limnocylindria bacterium]|nr:helix-turn-helix domain-containing protein [Candidatus Limnocylindria bacterium]